MRSPARPDRPSTSRHRHRLIAACTVAVLVGAAVAFLPAPGPVAADDGCPRYDRNGDCIVDHELPVPAPTPPSQPGPTRSDDDDPDTPDPNPARDDGYRCEFHIYPDQESWRQVPHFADAPPGSVFGEYHCFRDGRPIFGPYAPTFVPPDEALGAAPQPPPSPAEVAADAYVSVRARLKKPTVALNPPDPAASTIGLPTFVRVANWQGELNPPDHCLRGVCVSLRAVPVLTFDPGEPGVDTITCEDGGTAFDRHGADPDVQARPPACAHTYTRRTGVDGRPDAWPAEVTVTWTVHWSGGGDSGTLDPIALSTPFDREVEENVSVVTDYS